MALRHLLRNPVRFETVREFSLYCLIAVLLVPAGSAFAGAAARHFLFPGYGYWQAWEQWFLGDALAHLVITPVIFYWVLGSPWNAPARTAARRVEAGLLTVGLIVTAYLAFTTGEGEIHFAEPRFYAPVPFMFWAAIRFGVFGATGAIAVMAFFSVAAALQGAGPFAGHWPADTAVELQNFLLLRSTPLYLVAVLIEQKKAMENTLRESEERFRTMANTAPALIWMAGPDKLCDFVNQGWLDFTGRTLEQELGDGWTECVHGEDAQRCLETYRSSFDARQRFEMEYRARRYDGEYRWILDRGVPRYAPDGKFVGYVGFVFDIHDRKRAEQTLRENESALRASYDRIQDLAGRLITAQEVERSRIGSDLHDDVNQQLASFSISLSNVKRRLRDGADATVREELTRLQQRTIDLADVIRNLSHELHPGVLQHAGLSAALKGHCAEFSRQHAIEVTLSAVDDLGGIPHDVALCLYRVAQEALRNIGAHAAAHKAQVTLRSSKERLELVIADDGQGFNLSEARRVGGLGLISLDERVRLIGGSLTINTEPQRGTEVRVQVPLGGHR
jgi:PAS domain S-box-containing protein